MRFAALLATCLFAPLAAAQEKVPWANKLFAPNLEHDFGKVTRYAKPSHTFVLRNFYKVPLEITEVRTNCGCSTARISKKVVQPGETADLIVTVDGSRVDGPKYARIQVTVGPKFVSTATLYISVEPSFDLELEPRMVDFGLVPFGKQESRTVRIRPKNPEWRILSVVERKDSALKVKVETKKAGEHGVEVTLTGKAPVGSFREEVAFRTNDKENPLLTFPVQASIQGKVTITPGELNLGDIPVGTETVRRCVVRGAEPFRLLKAEGLGEGVAIPLPGEARPVHILDVRVRPSAAGMFRREIRLRTDLGGEVIELVVEGTAK